MVDPQSLIPAGVARLIGGIKDQIPVTQQTLGAATHKDAYQLLRRVATQTGSGTRSFTETVVESGMGSLAVRNVLNGEAVRADALGATATYTFTLPLMSTITPSDTLRIGTRTFTISGVQQGGHYAAFATADLEEKGTNP